MTGVDVAMATAASITGSVTDTQDGRGIEGIELFASCSPGLSATTRTATEGSYEVAGLTPGASCELEFSDPRGRYDPFVVSSVAPPAVVDAQLSLRQPDEPAFSDVPTHQPRHPTSHVGLPLPVRRRNRAHGRPSRLTRSEPGLRCVSRPHPRGIRLADFRAPIGGTSVSRVTDREFADAGDGVTWATLFNCCKPWRRTRQRRQACPAPWERPRARGSIGRRCFPQLRWLWASLLPQQQRTKTAGRSRPASS